MFQRIVNLFVGDPNKKVIDKLQPVVDQVAGFEAELSALTDEQLRERTAALRTKITAAATEAEEYVKEDQKILIDEALEDALPEAYALVREASRRTTGLRHYDVQIMGGTLLNRGHIIEMRTGEGKTLVATLPLFLNALTSKGVHLVTVNEYLARRDGGWMGNIFQFLGLTVGCIGPQQFSALYDAEYINPGAELEDERLVHWRPCTRREAYRADITYGIASEFGFDYLRDNMVNNPDRLVQRPFFFAAIDEVDNVLIDDARTPLIISGPADEASDEYRRFSRLVRNLRRNTVEDEDAEPNGHYDIDEKSRSITLTDMGTQEIEKRLSNEMDEFNADEGDSIYDPRFYQFTYYLDNALKAQYMFKNNKDYTVEGDEVVIIDNFTGRKMHGRRYSDGLHESIEAKEGVQIKRESVTVATITIQNYFRLYDKLAGMTGTAMTDAEEFQEIYKVEVTPLPTNVQYIVDYTDAGMITEKETFENSQRISYYKPNANEPSFFKRTDFPDQVYGTEEIKDSAIISEVKRVHETGRPILVGTTSVEHSERIHQMLKKEGIKHNVLNAKMHQSEALTVAQAGQPGAVTISTNMAGRGTDILLGGNPEGLAAELVEKELFDRNHLTQLTSRLISDGEASARKYADNHSKLSPDLIGKLLEIKSEFDTAAAKIEDIQVVGYIARVLQTEHGVDYEEALHVLQLTQMRRLNAAREYLKERESDTIIVDEAVRLLNLHTNYQVALQDSRKMAEFLAEQLFDLHYTARAALTRAVLNEELDQAHQIQQTIPGLPQSLIEKIQGLVNSSESQRKEVWRLGGLHVIGSERHESRRIDNQLRGRAGRQGDPGSSRFFLSLEDDLMRRFGGERLRNFMSRNVPDDMPIESSVLDRIISSSQERIEGYNFDIRKNVLEYDDVMAKQRETIYDERRKILVGELDADDKLDESFELVLDELVDNFLDNYIGYVQGEVDRAIIDFSAEATGAVNIRGVMARLRGLLPVHHLDQDELVDISPDQLTRKLMALAHENAREGRNLQQLLQAMGRFIPLLPGVPNLAATLSSRRSGHLQILKATQQVFTEQIQETFDNFLARHIEPDEREEIWNNALEAMDEAFEQFSVSRPSPDVFRAQQIRFRQDINRALRELLTDSLSALTSEQLVEALNDHVKQEQDKWRERIGEEEYRNFQRILLLSAIDREWRDYLTAADDLRREIGLESAGRQRDPKMAYKTRSYEMFTDMRNNIKRDIADRFFRQIKGHEDFIRKQEAQAAAQTRLSNAGYQVVQRQQGKGVELRREMPKVGRNDPCPCGSGKKYKQCHGRTDGRTPTAAPAVATAGNGSRGGRRRKKKRR